MNLDFSFFNSSFTVIKFVFEAFVSSLGSEFTTIIYFAIIIGSVSTTFGLGVSAIKNASRSSAAKERKGG